MKSYRLPNFKPVTQDELRRLWTEHPNDDVRRLVLEIERQRRVMSEVEGFFETFKKAWSSIGGGHLVGLHLFKILLAEEKQRVPES